MAEVGNASGRLELIDDWTAVLSKAFDGVKNFVDRVIPGFGEVSEVVGGMGEKFAEFGTGVLGVGAALTGAAVACFEFAEKASEAGENVLNFSRLTGAAVDSVGQLAATAQIGGSSLDSLQNMLFQMQRRMDATGPAAEKFDAALGHLGVSADAFRDSDPTERIKLLSEAMHNSAGSTTLMSDAIAVMGRGARENMPFLLKNFDDLQEKAKEVAYVWTDEDVKASEEFQESTKTLGVEFQTMVTTIGVSLLPAMTALIEVASRTVLAFEHIADLGGLISGGWVALKGLFGETANEEERLAAVQDTVNKLWKDASEESKDLGEQAEIVATSMLKLGFNQKVVAEQTGLTVDEVHDLAAELRSAEAEAVRYADAWDAVNKAFEGVDISGIDDATKGLAKDMVDAGVSTDNIAKALGLTSQQVNQLKEGFKELDKETKKYTEAQKEVESAGAGWRETIDQMDQSLLENIELLVKAGVAQDKIAIYLGATQHQVKAVAEELKYQDQVVVESTKLWDEYYDLLDQNSTTSLQHQKNKIELWRETAIDNIKAVGDEWTKQYNLINSIAAEKTEALNKDWSSVREKSREVLEGQLKDAQDVWDKMFGSSLTFSRDVWDAQKQKIMDLQDAIRNYGHESVIAHKAAADGAQNYLTYLDKLDKDLDAQIAKTRALGGSFNVTSQNFQQALQNVITSGGWNPSGQGSNIDMNMAYRLAQQGYSFQEILAIFANMKSGSSGPLPPPQGPKIPGFQSGGVVDVMVGEGGPEVVRMPIGSAVYPHGTSPPSAASNSVAITNHIYVNGTAEDSARKISDIIMRQLKSQRLFPAA